MLIHVASPNAPREASRLLHVPPFAEINTATSLSLWSSRDINSRDFRVADQSVLICVAQLFGWFAPAVVCYSEFRNVMELGAYPAITHQQEQMAPQEIAMLCSCEIGQESFPDGICDLFLVFLNGWKKKLDGVCVFTLGRRLLRWDRAGRPLYLYSPWTSIHILTWTVIQCGDTFYRSDGRSNHKAHTGSSASRFPFRYRVCLFVCQPMIQLHANPGH